MKKDLNYYLSLPYEIILRKLSDDEGGGYIARYKDFPFICADGENETQALKELNEAFKAAIIIMLENKDYIKEPKENDKKIRVNIMISKELLARVDKQSNNRSQFISECIKEHLESKV